MNSEALFLRGGYKGGEGPRELGSSPPNLALTQALTSHSP
jgi:hypothetical protein